MDKIINKNIEENDENLQDIVKKLKISLAKPSAFDEKIIQPRILQIVHNGKNEILKKFVNEIYKPKLNIDLGETKYDIFLDLNNKYDKEEFNSIENLDYDQKLCKLKENFKDDIQDLLGKLGNINDRTEQNDKKLQDIIENQLIKSLDKQNNFCEIKRNIIIDRIKNNCNKAVKDLFVEKILEAFLQKQVTIKLTGFYDENISFVFDSKNNYDYNFLLGKIISILNGSKTGKEIAYDEIANKLEQCLQTDYINILKEKFRKINLNSDITTDENLQYVLSQLQFFNGNKSNFGEKIIINGIVEKIFKTFFDNEIIEVTIDKDFNNEKRIINFDANNNFDKEIIESIINKIILNNKIPNRDEIIQELTKKSQEDIDSLKNSLNQLQNINEDTDRYLEQQLRRSLIYSNQFYEVVRNAIFDKIDSCNEDIIKNRYIGKIYKAFLINTKEYTLNREDTLETDFNSVCISLFNYDFFINSLIEHRWPLCPKRSWFVITILTRLSEIFEENKDMAETAEQIINRVIKKMQETFTSEEIFEVLYCICDNKKTFTDVFNLLKDNKTKKLFIDTTLESNYIEKMPNLFSLLLDENEELIQDRIVKLKLDGKKIFNIYNSLQIDEENKLNYIVKILNKLDNKKFSIGKLFIFNKPLDSSEIRMNEILDKLGNDKVNLIREKYEIKSNVLIEILNNRLAKEYSDQNKNIKKNKIIKTIKKLSKNKKGELVLVKMEQLDKEFKANEYNETVNPVYTQVNIVNPTLGEQFISEKTDLFVPKSVSISPISEVSLKSLTLKSNTKKTLIEEIAEMTLKDIYGYNNKLPGDIEENIQLGEKFAIWFVGKYNKYKDNFEKIKNNKEELRAKIKNEIDKYIDIINKDLKIDTNNTREAIVNLALQKNLQPLLSDLFGGKGKFINGDILNIVINDEVGTQVRRSNQYKNWQDKVDRKTKKIQQTNKIYGQLERKRQKLIKIQVLRKLYDYLKTTPLLNINDENIKKYLLEECTFKRDTIENMNFDYITICFKNSPGTLKKTRKIVTKTLKKQENRYGKELGIYGGFFTILKGWFGKFKKDDVIVDALEKLKKDEKEEIKKLTKGFKKTFKYFEKLCQKIKKEQAKNNVKKFCDNISIVRSTPTIKELMNSRSN